MSPVALVEPRSAADYVDLKSKVVDGHVEMEKSPAPPVPDNYMYDFKYNHELPTTQFLGREIPSDCDASAAADEFIHQLSQVWADGDAAGFAALFADYGQ